ncbi:MAG: isoleucine--tRNA ligase [Armatimonadetes bacterium]|nr:isoleucine--tRNA ligase [Armatimonadota bacterium]
MDYRKTVNLPQTEFAQRAGLAQSEPPRLARWLAEDLYGQGLARRADAPRYVLHDGPPYSNGNIHMGHALNKILKDIVTRYRDLRGCYAPYRPGWDNHGLPIEYAVTREFEEQGKQLDPLALRHACREYAQRWIDTQREQFKRLGVRGDWDKPYLTMAHEFEADILHAFAELAKAGYIYRGERIVQWAPTLQTALADAEIEYREKAIALREDIDYRVMRVGDRHYMMADYLAETLAGKFGWTGAETVKVLPGSAFAGVVTQHPLYERPSPIVYADYVTLEDGTGCVHTAPGHGKDDFETGRKNGLKAYCPVDGRGCFTPEVGDRLAGRFVFKANDEVCAMLAEAGALLAKESFAHQYPHDWRAHQPIIFRATTQWFMNIDHEVEGSTHRRRAVAATDTVDWHPAEGHDRIRPMIENRPDWCLSRQRAWGVGIPAFYCDCGHTVLDQASLDSVVAVVREQGSDAWFELAPEALLPADYVCPACGAAPATFTKETDVLDVWFDSGSTHQACYAKDELPVDLYFEGSDQHRGWFNSSLMVSVGLDGRAPYRAVVTHGFVLDQEGKAMSKSLGNVVAPSQIVDEFGADVLRLWVASVDFYQDMRMGKEVIARVTDTYRNLRNSLRFLLGNLHDFDPATDCLPIPELSGLDRYVLHRLERLKQAVATAYEEFAFHRVVTAMQAFAIEVSATYLDVAKDELYCGLPWGKARRGLQTVLYALCSELTRMLAPVLAFTADEVWEHLPGAHAASVHLEDWPAAVPERLDDSLAADFEALLAVRNQVKAAQETFNADKSKAERVNPLEMAITITADANNAAVLARWAGEIRALFVVSSVEVVPGDEVGVVCARAAGQRCARSWRVFPDADFGNIAGHETLSDRDALVVEALAERGLLPG